MFRMVKSGDSKKLVELSQKQVDQYSAYFLDSGVQSKAVMTQMYELRVRLDKEKVVNKQDSLKFVLKGV